MCVFSLTEPLFFSFPGDKHRLINSGSPFNVPAGHQPNLDHVTEHYRQAYAAEEERKAKALLKKAEAAAEAQKQQQQS